MKRVSLATALLIEFGLIYLLIGGALTTKGKMILALDTIFIIWGCGKWLFSISRDTSSSPEQHDENIEERKISPKKQWEQEKDAKLAGEHLVLVQKLDEPIQSRADSFVKLGEHLAAPVSDYDTRDFYQSLGQYKDVNGNPMGKLSLISFLNFYSKELLGHAELTERYRYYIMFCMVELAKVPEANDVLKQVDKERIKHYEDELNNSWWPKTGVWST